jgi:CHAT domain-containing protein/Flp pilus assembly protein TadD
MSFAGRLGIFAACLAMWGCAPRSGPQAAYDQIANQIARGDFNTALSQVNLASERFAADSPTWDWSFRIQKAQILIARSAPNEALAVLNGPFPASLSSTELPALKALFEGSAHMYLHQLDKSQAELSEAEHLAASSHPRLLSQVMNAQATLGAYRGNYAEAEREYTQAQNLAREHGREDQQVVAQVGLAWVATQQGHFDQAAERGQTALQLARSSGMQHHVATTLGNLGWNYSELGDFETARDFFEQGAQESAKSGMSGRSAYWFTGMANAYIILHQYVLAEDLARSTLQRARELKNAEVTVTCLNTLADIMLQTDRDAEAAKFNQQALEIVEVGQNKFSVLDTWAMAGRIYTARKDFAPAEQMYRRVLSDPSAGPELRWVCYAGLARTKDGEGNYPETEKFFLKAIGTIEQARQSVDHDELRLSFLNSGIAIYGQYIDFLMRRGRPGDALNEAEMSRARTLGEGLNSSSNLARTASRRVPPQQLAQRLKATLLFYWLGEQRSYLWLITPNQTAYFTLPAAAEIDPIVKSYDEALLATRDPLAPANPNGQKLYSMLVEPAKKLIPVNSHVILLPDGSLYGLNFETLIVPDPKPHYWIEDVTLSTGSSLALLSSSGARPAPKEKTLFLVGDTISPNDNFPKLVQAAEEMKDVERHFAESQTKVLSGISATPAAYLSSDSRQYSYLHFVTHGTASRARPLESAVILSKEKDEDSYKLYARDIVKRHLSAELVTISACNGAGTRAFSGEGLVGLSWAFLRAGAHNVIGALWEVSDTSTPQLMDSLYDGLSHGQDPVTALRAAKLSLLHSDSVYKKPYYWAPFQLYSGS